MNLNPKDWPAAERNRFFARFLIWQWVACALVALNLPVLSDPWTNWNYLFIACQIAILTCTWPKLRRLEIPLAHMLSRALKATD